MVFRFILLSNLFLCAAAAADTSVYLDPNMPIEARVEDLVSRMTLEEKVSQMLNEAPALPRLNIREYNWWNEALHGVAGGNVSTVFPQAIGLAATWNTDLHFRIATAISDEGRAKYHEGLRTGNMSLYYGLTFWSPNINIFRDPRWGRGQETYGEDPYLTGRFGVAFVKGLQGDDPKYLKTVSTPKHFAVHSGPEKLRHTFDTPVSEYDLWDTYLPAFEACVREAKCFSVMSAYNRFNNQPCTGSYRLLTEILRKKWGFTGYVVSDCDAVGDIYGGHKTVATAEEASAMAVKAGCDLNCGTTYPALVNAVKMGLITEKEIDAAVKNLFMARFRLGMFDPQSAVKYSQIPFSVNDSPAHDELAREAARQSMVLLKNDAKTLPLKKTVKTVAVIGPNADSLEVLLGNYNGTPSHPVTILAGIKRALEPNTKVLYAKGCPIIEDSNAAWGAVPSNVLFTDANCTAHGLCAEYFDNMELKGVPILSRIDNHVWFRWGLKSPSEKVPADCFSARWTGVLVAPKTGTYYMGLESDDGHRLYVDNKLVTQRWSQSSGMGDVAAIKLKKGQIVPVRVEFFENKGGASIRFKWSTAEMPAFDAAIEAARQADAVILVMGISSRFEREELRFKCDGFDDGDRTTLDLPKVQQQLMEKVCAVGKPTVLVLTGGSALSVNWADKHVPAILCAWYPGQRGGSAVADVLFGDYNPAGRLPVTFYKSVADLPAFEDYSMKGRTYRYFEGRPLYPFGYGLSYTSFSYSNFEVLQSKDAVTARITVKNTGERDGDEVVQLYISPVDSGKRVPLLALQGFKRIGIKAGQKQKVEFNLSAKQLAWKDENGNPVMPKKIVISVGNGKSFKDEKISLQLR